MAQPGIDTLPLEFSLLRSPPRLKFSNNLGTYLLLTFLGKVSELLVVAVVHVDESRSPVEIIDSKCWGKTHKGREVQMILHKHEVAEFVVLVQTACSICKRQFLNSEKLEKSKRILKKGWLS